jgi:hypothetical protein
MPVCSEGRPNRNFSRTGPESFQKSRQGLRNIDNSGFFVKIISLLKSNFLSFIVNGILTHIKCVLG